MKTIYYQSGYIVLKGHCRLKLNFGVAWAIEEAIMKSACIHVWLLILALTCAVSLQLGLGLVYLGTLFSLFFVLWPLRKVWAEKLHFIYLFIFNTYCLPKTLRSREKCQLPGHQMKGSLFFLDISVRLFVVPAPPTFTLPLISHPPHQHIHCSLIKNCSSWEKSDIIFILIIFISSVQCAQ